MCSYAEQIDQRGENGPNFKWTLKKLEKQALKYDSRTEFYRNNPGAYSSAKKRGLLDQICQHINVNQNISGQEQALFNIIKNLYPKTQKFRETKINIQDKPYIHSFEIDIYIPELRKGIEFDGDYFHSEKGLIRSRPKWPKKKLKIIIR